MGIAVGAGIAGGSLISGYFGQQGANAQASAEGEAAQLQYEMFEQQQKNLKPYYDAGYNALSQIQSQLPMYNKPFTSQDLNSYLNPGYQFQLDQGLNAVSKAAGASGSNVGGSALQSINNYAQNFASTQYQNAFNNYQTQLTNSYNRLANLAGLGSGAAQTGATTAAATGQGIGSELAGIGSAHAAGMTAIGNSVNSGISTGINYYQNQALLDAIKAKA